MNCIDSLPNCGPAVARWKCGNGNVVHLCQACLDAWFDSADDEPDLEPAAWSWLEKRKAAPIHSFTVLPDPPHIAEAIRDIRRNGGSITRPIRSQPKR